MKKVYILMPLLLSLVFIAASGGPGEIQNRERTGSPDGDNVCSQCHTTQNFSPTAGLMVTTTGGDITTSYIPGQTYLLSLAVEEGTQTAVEFGFQMSALYSESGAFENAGEFLNLGAQVQAEVVTNNNVTERNVIEHSSPSSTGVWQAEWTAPTSDVGDVTFYFSTVSANGNNTQSGDTYAGGSVVLTAAAVNSVTEKEIQEINMIQSEEGITFNTPATDILESLEVYTSTGRLVYSSSQFNTSEILDIDVLPNGISLIVVKDGLNSKVFKALRN